MGIATLTEFKYMGKRGETETTTPTNVVMSLMEGYLEKGHTLYTDNWYTSIDLGRKLLDKETHLVGTLCKNRKYLPKDVINGKIKKGEFRAKENEDESGKENSNPDMPLTRNRRQKHELKKKEGPKFIHFALSQVYNARKRKKERKRQWLRLISKEDLMNRLPQNYSVCEEHFIAKDILTGTQRKKLKNNSLPSLYLPDLQKKKTFKR
ncbi:hypothetical protein HW555_013827 [Spodoptera exigua]|uniref:THAP-type domain-containing protein n=1 Tax=Spodoptera exigua TaxID=7107 RepID=A0A835G3Y1_SPOEX|nr:hypothetical protein HW555_013827 [Spodoptera exigua]